MKKDSSDLLLLDVNVLLALAWPNHQFHGTATRTLEARANRWATCALTELAFIRLSSNPAAVTPAKSPGEARSLLEEMVRDRWHTYLESLPSPCRPDCQREFTRILGARQVTDAYLLALARKHRAVFVTFDSRLRELAGSAVGIRVLTQ